MQGYQVNIVREPKGGPDIVLLGAADARALLLKSGDFLSVRGFTARVVTLPDGVNRLSELPEDERARALAEGKPHINLADPADCGALIPADAAAIAAEAYRRIRT